MPELTPELRQIAVDPRKLILDPNNPRLITRDEDRKEEDHALDLLDETMSRMRESRHRIEELEGSIKRNGWLPVDFIFVKKLGRSGRYLVLEGNRRVTAVRNLLREDDELSEDLKRQLSSIDVMEVTDDLPPAEIRQKIVYLLGVRHHGSLKKWTPFAQAHNIYMRYMELLESRGESTDFYWDSKIGGAVADALSITVKDVEERLRVYRTMKQLGETDTVRESEGGMKDRYYSVCAEVVLAPKRYGDYIKQDSRKFTLSDETVERMINLCHFDREGRAGSPISNPTEWRKLAQILDDKDPEKRKEMLYRVEKDKEKPSDVYAERASELQSLQWDHWLNKVVSILKRVTIEDGDAAGAQQVTDELYKLIEHLETQDKS